MGKASVDDEAKNRDREEDCPRGREGIKDSINSITEILEDARDEVG